MPFVRISLRKDLSHSTKEQISEGVHEALVAEFNVPQDDFFHVIEELEPHQLKYPNHYLGVDHTPNMVYVQITAGAGRTPEQKRKLYTAIAHNIAQTTEIKQEDIIIILSENDGHNNWSFGNGEAQKPMHIK